MSEAFAIRMIRRLKKDATPGSASDGLAGTLAACRLLHIELSLWLGVDGSRALFTSAIGRARPDHPALGDIQHDALLSPSNPGIARGVEIHGDAVLSAALEATLVVLVELLGRLIGDDMASRIVENGAKNGGSGLSPGK